MCCENTSLKLLSQEETAQWKTMLVNSSMQPDSHISGFFAYTPLRHRLRRREVCMTGGSGDLIRFDMLFEVMLHGRRFDSLRS